MQDRKLVVDASQVLAIVAGAKATRLVAGRRFSNEIGPLLEQLRRSLPRGKEIELSRVERKVHITRTGEKPYHSREDLQEMPSVMVDGLMIEKPVTLAYLSHARKAEGKEPVEMTVKPLAMVFHRGGAYFVVEIVESIRRISLALDRIQRASLREDLERFDYPGDFDAEDLFAEAFGINLEGTLHQVVLRISPKFAPYAMERQWGRGESFEVQDDGGVVMRFSVRGEREVLEWVGGMGSDAEILEPPALRDTMRARLLATLDAYERGGRPGNQRSR